MSDSSKSPALTRGYLAIDDDHPQLHARLESLQKADNVAFPTLFAALQAHAIQHVVSHRRFP